MKTNSIAIAKIASRMASEQDTMAIPSEPPNFSQAWNPVFQSDNTLNLETGCSNEKIETWVIFKSSKRTADSVAPKNKQTTNPIPQPYHSSIATQKSEDQSQQLETTEEIGETSIVRRSSRSKVKTAKDFIPSNSGE